MMAVPEARKGQSGDRVRTRILIPFSFVILFVIGAFLVSAYLLERREHQNNLTESVAAVERLFRQGLEKDAGMMHAALTAIALDEGLKRAFLRGSREALLKRAWPLFDNLRSNSRITHFYFTGPDRVNYLRVHQPNEHGDTINRISTLRAAETREVVRGLELGPLGTFTLRAVLPWYDGKTLIGYLELGEEIDHLADEVHSILGAELLVLIDQQFLDPQHWETGKKMLGHQNDLRRFGSSVVVGRAMEKIPDDLATLLEQDQSAYENGMQTVEDGKHLYVGFLPLADISGREVGDFVVVRDITGQWTAFRNSMIFTVVVSILAGSVVFAIFYAILGKVERDYRRQREVELQLSRINTEHQKVVQVEKLSAMGLMIGEIAHQLNNPLAGVINMAQLAEREVHDPDRTKELLSAIGKAGKDCHGFVKRMLEFTKISCFDRKPTQMNLLIEDTVALFQQSLGSRSKVVTRLPENSPTLKVDPVLVRHALFNLLSNAAQASPAGGTITIDLSEQRLQEEGPGWRLSVHDHGPGVADDIVDKIFTPFFTTRTEGTGLGLPVVQHVAILHEGRITVTNPDEGGALFALWLPDMRAVT